jgi:phenylalanine-4-hydroxylase
MNNSMQENNSIQKNNSVMLNNSMLLEQQQYELYTVEDLEVWSALYNRQMNVAASTAYRHFEGQLKKLGFTADAIPEFKNTNELLEKLTGWTIYAVPGLIPNSLFFKFMVNRRFGATTWLRKKEQLDYLEEPDMFHDVFGHVPLLADPVIANYLLGLARIAERYLDNEEAVECISRLYWYTIEFGLVKEGWHTKIYGAGILSSISETQFVLSPKANRVPFNLYDILQTPYIKDKFQEQYFVLESMGQFKRIIIELDHFMRRKYA